MAKEVIDLVYLENVDAKVRAHPPNPQSVRLWYAERWEYQHVTVLNHFAGFQGKYTIFEDLMQDHDAAIYKVKLVHFQDRLGA